MVSPCSRIHRFVVRVLFAADVTGAGILMSRIAGIGLLGFGVACLPSDTPGQPATEC